MEFKLQFSGKQSGNIYLGSKVYTRKKIPGIPLFQLLGV